MVSQTSVEWQPDTPPKGWLTAKRLARYQAGRNEVYQDAADITGRKTLVVDL